MSASSSRPVSPTNELAKERNRAAAERTMTAWISNCLTLIGIGFTLNEIQEALAERFPSGTSLSKITLTQIISTGFVVSGILLLILAVVQHHLEVTFIEKEEYLFLPLHSLNRIVISAIIVFSTVGVFSIMLSL